MIGNLRIALAVAAAAAVTLVLLPVHLLALRFDWPIAARIPRIWHRLVRPMLGLKVTVNGELDRRRPLMLVANHASWLDIVVLASIADVAFIAKSEVRDWPVFGNLARWQRSVFVDRDARRSAGAQIREIAARLDRGEVVVLFAEGTTSDGNHVLPFKSSLFGAARAAAATTEGGFAILQPAAIAYLRVQGLPMGRRHRALATWPGDVPLAPHLLGVLREGAIDVEVRFGDPVVFDAGGDRKAVSGALRSKVRHLLTSALRGK